MKNNWTIILLLLIVPLFGCKRINYYPEYPIEIVNTKLLAHRGGGKCEFPENTLDAVKYGFSKLDGVEVDIQISGDGTIWLSHDAVLPACDGKGEINLYSLSDTEICEWDTCFHEIPQLAVLDDVFKLMQTEYPNKKISLDVKTVEISNDESVKMKTIYDDLATGIIRLAKKYQIEHLILAESEVAYFLNQIKDKSNIECYLGTYGDFERGVRTALDLGYDGISFKYNYDEIIDSSHVKLLHKKGLKIQVWVINGEEEMLEALQIRPDYIQTDDTDLFSDD